MYAYPLALRGLGPFVVVRMYGGRRLSLRGTQLSFVFPLKKKTLICLKKKTLICLKKKALILETGLRPAI